jgi:hypothetical protein
LLKIGKKFDIIKFDTITKQYRSARDKENVEEKEIVGFSQKYNNDITFEQGRGEGGGGTIIKSSKLSLYEGYFLVKTFFYAPKEGVFTFDKSSKSIKINDGGASCDFTIKQVSNKIIIDGYCGC